VKPFAMRELEARIRALHRRAQDMPSTLAVGDLAYDAGAMVAMREGRCIPLTRLQGTLLATLLHDAPKVSTHQRLLRAAWQDGGDIAALHTQMYELRALVDRPFPHRIIQSVHGVGYRVVTS
jgi:DNA-binding response OmpR family regulator